MQYSFCALGIFAAATLARAGKPSPALSPAQQAPILVRPNGLASALTVWRGENLSPNAKPLALTPNSIIHRQTQLLREPGYPQPNHEELHSLAWLTYAERMVDNTNDSPQLVSVAKATAAFRKHPEHVRIYKSWWAIIDPRLPAWKRIDLVQQARILAVGQQPRNIITGVSAAFLQGIRHSRYILPVEITRSAPNWNPKSVPEVNIAADTPGKHIRIPAQPILFHKLQVPCSQLSQVQGVTCVPLAHAVIDAASRLKPLLGLSLIDSYLHLQSQANRYRQEDAYQAERLLKVELQSILSSRGRIHGCRKVRELLKYATCMSESWPESWVRTLLLAVGGDDAVAQPRFEIGTTQVFPDVFSPRLQLSVEMHGQSKYKLDPEGRVSSLEKQGVRQKVLQYQGITQIDVEYQELDNLWLVQEIILRQVRELGRESLLRPVPLFLE